MRKYEEEIADYNQILEKGECLFDLKRYKEAIVCFDRALEIPFEVLYAKFDYMYDYGDEVPKSVICYYSSIWHQKGLALKELKKYEEAIACFDQVLEINPCPNTYYNINCTNIWEEKALTLEMLELFDEAIACYSAFLVIKPYDVHFMENKSRLLYKLGRYQEALACDNLILDVEPENVFSQENKSSILYLLKQRCEATINCPDNKEDLNAKGVDLKESGYYEESLIYFNQALDIDHNYIEARCNKALVLYALKCFRGSKNCFDYVLKIDPTNVTAWTHKGMQLSRDKAIVCFDKVLKYSSDCLDAWIGKGNELKKMSSAKTKGYKKRLKEAILCYNQALMLKADCVEALVNKGLALRLIREHKKAIACYDLALEYKSNCIEAWTEKVIELKWLKQNKEALDCCELVLEIIKPDDKRIWGIKRDLLESQGRYEEVLACYEHIDLNEIEWSRKARILTLLERYEEAISCYDYALKYSYCDIDFLNAKGNLLEKLERCEKAFECYNLVLKRDLECFMYFHEEFEDSYLGKIRTSMKLERYEETLNAYDQAYEFYSKYVVGTKVKRGVLKQKGQFLEGIGRHNEAILCYEKIAEIELNER
jgi:tetratricopeptide (TPR) repeat protein